ncbi:TetR/AcrR family transcriptional regulator [Nocardioides aestuarii]|uniref:TetR/AcrR family transcriptional regulator n=1 Tax=Nocardioides aestuarii TaxID=252231 RepID=A0ABW4TJ35_9ACTN
MSPELSATDGRRRRWDQHKAERRRAVLAAALEVIEEVAPGEDVHVQQIADRAGLSRTVLYRHFADRADLDRAIQAEIVDRVWGEIVPVLSLDGTPVEVVRRIVATYVEWAAAHPALHRFAEADVPGEGPSALARMVEQAAAQIEGLITLGAELLEVPLDDDLRSALDPLVFGLVGAGMASVRRWTAQPDRVATDVFVDLLTQAVWLQIAGMAAARGVVIDPDRLVQDLFDTRAG